MKFNRVLYCILAIGVTCIMIGCLVSYQKKRTESIQNQIQSLELVQVYAGKTSLNSVLTDNISEIWFSDEVTDGRVDIDSACARYSMTDTEIRAFTEHYSDYAIIDIPLKIVNSSDVTIGGFHLSFVNNSAQKVIWLYSENVGGLYSLVESGNVGNKTAQALVNLTDCPMEMIDEMIRDNGLKLLFDFTTKDGQLNQKTIDVLFD